MSTDFIEWVQIRCKVQNDRPKGDAMTTARELALELRDAERDGTDTDRIIGAQNAVLDHLNVPLDWTEQGINEQASMLLDLFVQRNLAP